MTVFLLSILLVLGAYFLLTSPSRQGVSFWGAWLLVSLGASCMMLTEYLFAGALLSLGMWVGWGRSAWMESAVPKLSKARVGLCLAFFLVAASLLASPIPVHRPATQAAHELTTKDYPLGMLALYIMVLVLIPAGFVLLRILARHPKEKR